MLTQYDIQLFKVGMRAGALPQTKNDKWLGVQVIEKHIGLTLSEHELNGDEVASQFKVVNSKLRMARLRLDEYAMKMRKAGKSRKKIAG